MDVISVRKTNGVDVTVFTPTRQMQMFAMTAFCDPAAVGKSPDKICEIAGISQNIWKKFISYEPYFSEWLEDRRAELGGKNKKALLEAVGMESALKGDFQFWKPLAIREGVISEDKIKVGLELPANLSGFKELNEDELAKLRNSLMGSLRSVENSGAIDLVEGPDGWKPEGDSAGAGEVPEGSVVLSEGMGSDGERALDDLATF